VRSGSELPGLETFRTGLQTSSGSEDTPFFLIGDPTRLGQILINLTDNAIKFTESGEVIVTTERVGNATRDEAGRVMLKFSVQDTGIGLTESQISKLFRSFTQADGSITRKYGGTGLGLAICKHLAEMTGGEISVDSVPGKGSVFSFTAMFGCQPADRERHLIPNADFRGMRVLVADDNAASLNILKESLESFSFRVTAAASGKEALYELRNAPEEDPFELILMDWKMPDMSGTEAAEQIKGDARLSRILFILMVTAYGREEVIQHAGNACTDAFLIKPVNPSVLFDTIMETLGQEVVRESRVPPVEIVNPEDLKHIRGASVLLVEDNKINQQVAAELLESAEMIVTVANNGREALQILGNLNFDLVFMDIQMPEMDGIRATDVIRSDPRFKGLPIVAMTAHALTGDRERFLKRGMDDHLAKPIKPEKLFSTLVRWIKPGPRASRKETQKKKTTMVCRKPCQELIFRPA